VYEEPIALEKLEGKEEERNNILSIYRGKKARYVRFVTLRFGTKVWGKWV
jgi:hypothetical protein